MKTLTEAQKKEYMLLEGYCCPYCGSENVDANRALVEGGFAWRRVCCNDCHEKWEEAYKLVDIY